MFYSEAMLSRRGPLGRVWLAAHMERKLSKSQTLQTDIEQSVDAILEQKVETFALRYSGQLLLGVVRIYSRKTKYLLDDCNDALLKIKMAFRPGVVDLTEDQLNVNKTAITLQATNVDLDLLLPDVNWDMDFEERTLTRELGHHQAHIEDITLPSANGLDQFGAADPFDIGPTDGIGSQDFVDIDLGIDWDEEPTRNNEDAMSVDESIGVGRDAASFADGFDLPHLNGARDIDLHSLKSLSRDPSEQPYLPPMDMDLPDFGNMDLGDIGVGFDQPEGEGQEVEGQKDMSSRASSPLTEVPDTPIAGENPLPEPTTVAPPKKQREKKQIIDVVTELHERQGGRADIGPMKDVSNIVGEQHFLPRSLLAMRLSEIRNDPLNHFMPVKSIENKTFFSAAPPGLAPDLANLFLRPLETATAKRRYASPSENVNKRQRIEEDVEEARRATSVPRSIAGFTDRFEDPNVSGGLDFGEQPAPFDDYQLELPNEDEGVHVEGERARSVSTVRSIRSRHSTPGEDGWAEGEESYADVNCPIAMFDTRQPAQSQTQDDQVGAETQGEESEDKGYSKNTVKALGLIRKELQTEEDQPMSFKAMATKASRRAAASFFFELLVLGTRDCLQLSQPSSFEDIEVRGKPNLWQLQRHGESAPISA